MEKIEYLELNAHINKKYALIWLHGLGANADDFNFISDLLGIDNEYYVVCPNAPIRPVTINQNVKMRSWHDIASLTDPEKNRYEGIFESEQLIISLIEELVSKGFDYQSIILGGFSQGGAMSLWIGARYEHQLKGLICLSGYIPIIFLEHEESLNRFSNLPIFFGHGNDDQTVLLEHATASIEWLESKQYTIDKFFYSVGHEICQDEFQDLQKWLNKNEKHA